MENLVAQGVLDIDIMFSSFRAWRCLPTFFIIIIDHNGGWLNVGHKVGLLNRESKMICCTKNL